MIEKKVHTVMKECVETLSETFICDVCKKEGEYVPSPYKWEEVKYYHIITGHQDWGNDSIDSIEETDACCEDCLYYFLAKWLKEPEVARSDTAYFNIQKERHARIKVRKNEQC